MPKFRWSQGLDQAVQFALFVKAGDLGVAQAADLVVAARTCWMCSDLRRPRNQEKFEQMAKAAGLEVDWCGRWPTLYKVLPNIRKRLFLPNVGRN